MSYALDWGKIVATYIMKFVAYFLCASRPDAEKRTCIVRTLLFWFIYGNTASYIGSSELLKIWC